MPRITEYSFGRIVVDGAEHDRDVIILPDRVVSNWWRKDGHSLVESDLEGVIDDLPNRLIVGCGAYGRLHPAPETLDSLRKQGIKVEVVPTGEAVERLNASDLEKTAAALHLTC
jgi:hypothetical protein